MAAPILDALNRYKYAARYRFHMPGHKGALDISAERDVTELPGLDNLRAPSGCIMEAQALLAEAFGASRSFFLVNGSSAGIIAFLLSLGQNKQILLERGAHTSFAAGLALSGHAARFLPQRYYDGVPLPSVPEDVIAMLKSEHFDAVCLVSPNYYGLCADIPAIAALCSKAGVPLFIDEAHGAHFIAGAPFPKGAAGFASAWVQSAHKTLTALTQGAYLHLSKDIDAGRVQSALSLVQTTSPSYLLLESLDSARAGFDPERWRETALRCDEFREAANTIEGITAFADTFEGFARDATRVVIDVSARCSGFEAADALFARGVAVEMADAKRIVLIITPCDPEDWPGALLNELRALPGTTCRGELCSPVDIPHKRGIIAVAGGLAWPPLHAEPLADRASMAAGGHAGPPLHAMPVYPPEEIPEAVISVRDAVLGVSELVPLEEAAGRVSAAAIGLYPPGTPLIWPGERIGDAMAEYLLNVSRLGGDVFGLDDGRVRIVT